MAVSLPRAQVCPGAGRPAATLKSTSPSSEACEDQQVVREDSLCDRRREVLPTFVEASMRVKPIVS